MNSYILFHISSHRMLLKASAVSEIIKDYTLYPIPRAPQEIIGMTPLRGTIVIVLSLHSLLEASSKPPKDALLLIVKPFDEALGILVDKADIISEVEKIEPCIQDNPLKKHIQQQCIAVGEKAFFIDVPGLFLR